MTRGECCEFGDSTIDTCYVFKSNFLFFLYFLAILANISQFFDDAHFTDSSYVEKPGDWQKQSITLVHA